VIRDEAERLCRRLQERFGAGASLACTVEPLSERIEFTAPGGARPHLIRYRIKVEGGGRCAHLGLDDAEQLLAVLPDGCSPDVVFGEIAGRGFAVEGSA
jgi:hypothetical protein